MSPLTLLPLLLTALGTAAAPVLARRLAPRCAVLVLCAVATAAAVSSAAALALVVLAAADTGRTSPLAAPLTVDPAVPGLSHLIEWCGRLYDHRAPMWAVPVAVAVLGLGAVRLVGWRRRWRQAVDPWAGAGPVEILPGQSTAAFAVPGGRGTVVVGQGLLDALDPDEQQVVFAHERAHLGHGHHRYVQVGEMAAAAFPFLRPLARHIRLATERWADEDAARHVGDRRVVARALIKAALAEPEVSPLPQAATGHVTTRVSALLDHTPTGLSASCARPASILSVVATLAAATIQLHHLAVFAEQATRGHL